MKKSVLVSFLIAIGQLSNAQSNCTQTRAGCIVPQPQIVGGIIENVSFKKQLVQSLPYIGQNGNRVFVTEVYGAAIEQLSGIYTLVTCSVKQGFGRAPSEVIGCEVKETADLSLPGTIFLSNYEQYPIISAMNFVLALDGQGLGLGK